MLHRALKHLKTRPASLTSNFFFLYLQYTAAVKTSSLDPTASALAKLGDIVQSDAKLAAILSAPTLTDADKTAIVEELAKQAGAKNDTVKNFLETLAENNRLGLLGGICEKFGTLMSSARGEVEMTVTSATVCLPEPACKADQDVNWI